MKTARLFHCLIALALFLGVTHPAGTAEAVRVSLFLSPKAGDPSRYAFEKLKAALQARKVSFETVSNPDVARGSVLLWADFLTPPVPPESLRIRRTTRNGKPLISVSGADERGLAYALWDITKRVGWGQGPEDPFLDVRDATESPAVADRGMTIFTMQQAQFENRLHNEDYWAKYFDTLIQNRFNTFQLLFAYDMDGYMCPAYPYFQDVAQFPDVHVVGLTKAEQARNFSDLKRLIRMAHQRGLKVTIGFWCHYYRYSGSSKPIDKGPVKGKVWGLNETNLIPYTKAAMAQFLQTFPEIDNMMFLLHGESGLLTEEMKPFWSAVFPVLKQYGPQIQYELRAKGVPDDLIQIGLHLGLKMRFNTKFWEEHVGLPFHPTHIQPLSQFERRHSYSDMLKYPRPYNIHWTLWTAGTMRVLLWGDPEYVRRFAGAVGLGGMHGFDVMEPLATKMSFHPHDMQPFDLMHPEYRYYEYEFQRYWHFFQVFGLLTYDPQTPREVWDQEFLKRFGPNAGPVVEQALHRASQILPRIEAYVLPSSHFPNIRGWAERQRMEDLPLYAASLPSDTAQFRSFTDAAADIVEGRDSAAISPLATSVWFAHASEDVLRLAAQAEQQAGPNPSKEFRSTLVDLRILANLALYHSKRIPAGLSYALFLRTKDLNALDDAIADEKNAIHAWEGVVQAAGNVYNDDLMMGLPANDMTGSWRDQLPKLQKGLAKLEQQRADFRPEPPGIVGRYYLGDGALPEGYIRLGRSTRNNRFDQNLANVAIVNLPNGRYRVKVGIQDESPTPKTFGPMWIEANGNDYSDVFMVPAGQRVERELETSVADGKLYVLFDVGTSGTWHASTLTVTSLDPQIAQVPVRRVQPGQDVAIRATVNGVSPIAKVVLIYGDSEHGYKSVDMANLHPWEYGAVIPAANIKGSFHYFLRAFDDNGRRAATNSIDVEVSTDVEPPVLNFTPIQTAQPSHPLRIVAEVQDPSGIKWVHLRYRGLSQHQDFRTAVMLPTGNGNEFEAEIPGTDIDPKFDFMYYFETMDNAGNGKIYPDLEKETPYTVVKVQSANQ
ncbi:MAG TPA: hypothetical protein VG675_19215 [Bryobacteraceae bacterium]|nr:hypothetical protein [Bryobacteraceae bacterium]